MEKRERVFTHAHTEEIASVAAYVFEETGIELPPARTRELINEAGAHRAFTGKKWKEARDWALSRYFGAINPAYGETAEYKAYKLAMWKFSSNRQYAAIAKRKEREAILSGQQEDSKTRDQGRCEDSSPPSEAATPPTGKKGQFEFAFQ